MEELVDEQWHGLADEVRDVWALHFVKGLYIQGQRERDSG